MRRYNLKILNLVWSCGAKCVENFFLCISERADRINRPKFVWLKTTSTSNLTIGLLDSKVHIHPSCGEHIRKWAGRWINRHGVFGTMNFFCLPFFLFVYITGTIESRLPFILPILFDFLLRDAENAQHSAHTEYTAHTVLIPMTHHLATHIQLHHAITLRSDTFLGYSTMSMFHLMAIQL